MRDSDPTRPGRRVQWGLGLLVAAMGVAVPWGLGDAALGRSVGDRPLEGFGASTEGGANGAPFVVTSLDNDGPGTLRDAVSAPNRNITFSVGGTISLSSGINVTTHHLTIDGSSAPGPGITLTHSGIHFKSSAADTAHDVIMTHIRSIDGTDNLSIGKGAYRIVIDHCSFRRPSDGNIDIYDDVNDVTIQWCIIGEGVKNSLIRTRNRNISLHHNFYAHGDERNPQVQEACQVVDMVNNVVFDWASNYGTRYRGASTGNMVKNYYLAGPRSDLGDAIVLIEGALVYSEGNIIPPESDAIGTTQTRWPAAPITEMTPEEALDAVLNEAGAFPRDADDQQYVSDARDLLPVRRTSWGRVKEAFRD